MLDNETVKMLFAIWMMLLATIQLAKTGHVQNKPPQLSYICDDEQINAIANKLELVQVMNQNIQLKLDFLNMSNYQLFEELKMAVAAIEIPKDEHKQCDCTATTIADGFSSVNSTASVVDGISSTAAPAVIPSFCQSGQNGIQLIQIPNTKLSPFYVNCFQDLHQGNDSWLLIQRRRDGNIDFSRDFSDYQHGFGNLEGDFFIGLNKLHALTQSSLCELWIKMVDSLDNARWVKYSSFAIGDESQAYALNILGNFTGNAGDSLAYHAGQKFTTKDRDYDDAEFNCAVSYEGGWWFKRCRVSNLNGIYLIDSKVSGKHMAWETWKEHNLLKYVHMAIRPVNVTPFKD